MYLQLLNVHDCCIWVIHNMYGDCSIRVSQLFSCFLMEYVAFILFMDILLAGVSLSLQCKIGWSWVTVLRQPFFWNFFYFSRILLFAGNLASKFCWQNWCSLKQDLILMQIALTHTSNYSMGCHIMASFFIFYKWSQGLDLINLYVEGDITSIFVKPLVVSENNLKVYIISANYYGCLLDYILKQDTILLITAD